MRVLTHPSLGQIHFTSVSLIRRWRCNRPLGLSISKMEPLTTVLVDKFKNLAKSTDYLVQGFLNPSRNSYSRNPIEILKRLQREAFSDIMKIRDRQDKVERILTFYKTAKGSPFEETSTHVRGKIDVLGAVFVMDSDEEKVDAIRSAGIRTGVDTRLSFQTVIREKDTLAAEFVVREKGRSDVVGGPLSLAKLFYTAHVSDWFSAVAIHMGGQCRDAEIGTSYNQERALTIYSEFGPPFLNQHNGSAIGLKVRKLNVAASLAQFVSAVEFNSDGIARSLSTFGQIVWQITGNTKLSLLGVHKESRSSSQSVNLGDLALPFGTLRITRSSETPVEEDNSVTSSTRHVLDGSMALMFESEFEESKRLGGWIETKNMDPRSLQWSVSTSDTPEDEFGWGLTMGGLLHGPKNWDHFQVESFLNLNFGKRFKLQPAVVYVKDGATQFPALMLRSSWSL